MMTPELLRLLYEYNQWGNKRILDACATLEAADFTRDLASSFKSVHDTLVHIYGAEWAWQERILGRSPASLPAVAKFPTFAAVRKALEDMDRHYIDYVSQRTPQSLDGVVEYKSLAGEAFSNPLWQILHHLTNHSTYHRGQVVTMLRQLGRPTASTDAIGFYRQRAAAPAA